MSPCSGVTAGKCMWLGKGSVCRPVETPRGRSHGILANWLPKQHWRAAPRLRERWAPVVRMASEATPTSLRPGLYAPWNKSGTCGWETLQCVQHSGASHC